MPEKVKVERFLPFLLSLLIIVLDQISKALVVAQIPVNTIAASFFGDFFRIIHVRNLGIAFSIGSNALGEPLRILLFLILPSLVLLALAAYTILGKEFTKYQAWLAAGIIGGGAGNLVDRYLRSEGVVDFIDVKFYGLFGLERWPTFNIADSAVVVCGILFAISLLVTKKGNS